MKKPCLILGAIVVLQTVLPAESASPMTGTLDLALTILLPGVISMTAPPQPG